MCKNCKYLCDINLIDLDDFDIDLYSSITGCECYYARCQKCQILYIDHTPGSGNFNFEEITEQEKLNFIILVLNNEIELESGLEW